MADDQIQLNIGAINPYALAELRLGKKVNWRRTPNSKQLLEVALGMPYEQLFDPKNNSPIYIGLKLSPDGKTIEKDLQSPIFKGKTVLESTSALLKEVHAIASRASHAPATHSAVRASSGGGAATAAAAARAKPSRFAHVLPHLLNTMPGVSWVDPGHFFEDASQPMDVIQGALGDCYFVAPLASVAWAHPFTIAQRTRNTDAAGQFSTPGAVDLILFSSGGTWSRVEVSELLPLQEPGNHYIYARADRSDETWPAVYEKAYAKWRTNDPGDEPNYAPISGGDPVAAAAQITGLTGSYFWTSGMTPFDIWQTVRAHSLSYKTFDPMVAWTYPTSDPSVGRNYASANIVANHAYSILGWHSIGTDEYIVLRNPWGSTEATLNVEHGTWIAYDGSFWHPVTLSSQGIFSLRADTFQLYYQGLGVVTGSATLPSF